LADNTEHIPSSPEEEQQKATQNRKRKLPSSPTERIQLQPITCSASMEDYKRQQGIQASGFIATPVPSFTYTETSNSADTVPTSVDSFSNPLTYTSEFTFTTAATLSTSTCNNKEDILMQSQILKDNNSSLFIKSQQAEINNLVKTDLMMPHPIQELPPRAKLISTIWSYRQKHLPDGTLIKHKARMCINGKQQELRRDYWETYASVASWATIFVCS
jgi:hypothetical protein